MLYSISCYVIYLFINLIVFEFINFHLIIIHVIYWLRLTRSEQNMFDTNHHLYVLLEAEMRIDESGVKRK